jgi:hypothetical protein
VEAFAEYSYTVHGLRRLAINLVVLCLGICAGLQKLKAGGGLKLNKEPDDDSPPIH